jgi:cell division protein FtsZ
VVATGLNRGAQRVPVDAFAGAPMRSNFRVVRTTDSESMIAVPQPQPQPTQRPQQVRRFGSNGGGATATQATAETEYDYLDIPAFLRRQAD